MEPVARRAGNAALDGGYDRIVATVSIPAISASRAHSPRTAGW
ncbi:hypothetical protein ACGFR8_21445 [Streptomyces brevispora]